jgi:hypothetical protein
MMAIYFKTIYGNLVNCDFIESIYLDDTKEKDYKIKAYPVGDPDCSGYVLYRTTNKKDAEDKLNEIINFLEKNGNKIIDLTPEEESEDDEQVDT